MSWREGTGDKVAPASALQVGDGALPGAGTAVEWVWVLEQRGLDCVLK